MEDVDVFQRSTNSTQYWTRLPSRRARAGAALNDATAVRMWNPMRTSFRVLAIDLSLVNVSLIITYLPIWKQCEQDFGHEVQY